MPTVRIISEFPYRALPTIALPGDLRDLFKRRKDYKARVRVARRRVLDVIRFASPVPLRGYGHNHEIRIDPSSVKSPLVQLAHLVDETDGRRARAIRCQSESHLVPGAHLRSPQDIKWRRSTLFGGKDIPMEYYNHMPQAEINRVVDTMRWIMICDAIEKMHRRQELVLLGDRWLVSVSVMDRHIRRVTRRPSVKRDDRSFHGRPNRDRHLVVATT